MRKMCDCLVDQGRTIGGDPVGYHCIRDAMFEASGVRFCIQCREMLEHEPKRIMFYLPAGREDGFKNNREVLEGMKEIL